jgi:ADP-ribose pyrophosphatase YjhB (NUDIX family)
MSTGSDLGQLSFPERDWYVPQSVSSAHMTPWPACKTNDFEQACAVPFRRRGKRIEFCLITSSAGRWMFPKGLINRGDTPLQTARREALEEAGLRGRVLPCPLGCYSASKNGRTLSVLVLLMEVSRSDEHWEEADRRQRCWVSATAARKLLCQTALHDCLDAALARVSRG